MQKPINVQIIESNEASATILKDYLLVCGLHVEQVFHDKNVADFLQNSHNRSIDIIFLNLFLTDSKGINTYKIISNTIDSVIVILASNLYEDVCKHALVLGAEDYLIEHRYNENVLAKTITYSFEKKKLKAESLASEVKYRQLFYGNPIPMYIFEMETLQIIECNDATLKKYGYTRDAFIKLKITDLRLKEDLPDFLAFHGLDEATKTEINKTKIWRHIKSNGEIMLVELALYPIKYDGKNLKQVQINDVTDKVKLREALEDQERERQLQITSATINAQEQEREQLGRELHDNINQILITSLLYLDYMLVSKEVKLDLLQISKDFVSQAITEIRTLSKKLVPPALSDVGLISAIENLIAHLQLIDHFHIDFTYKHLEAIKITDALSLTIYRIVQEQMNNIIKHAKATDVFIGLYVNDNSLLLEIIDNGVGYDVTQKSVGLGLHNINTRAALQNGHVTIDASPQKGFKLSVEFKLCELQTSHNNSL